MSSSDQFTIDQSDLEKLNDKDKAELRQFFANEEQRARVHAQTHELTSLCFKKCVGSTSTSSSTATSFFRGGGSSSSGSGSGALDKTEQGCLANCVERFLDTSFATVKHVATMRQQVEH